MGTRRVSASMSGKASVAVLLDREHDRGSDKSLPVDYLTCTHQMMHDTSGRR